MAQRSIFVTPAEIVGQVSMTEYAPLVTTAAWTKILRLGDGIPVPVHTVFLECRLGEGDDRTDFGACLLPGPRLLPLIEAVRTKHEPRAIWTRVAAFLEKWSSFTSPLSTQVPFLFLAFDGEGTAIDLPDPSLSLCVDPHFAERRIGLGSPPLPTGAEVLNVTRDCHARLAGEPLSSAAADQLLLLTDDEDLEIKHVSLMLARAGTPAKVDLRLRIDRLASYLQRIAWPAAAATAARLQELVPWGGHVQLNLRLVPGEAEALEIEIFTGRVEASREQRFQLLERLVERGLAARDKVRVLRELHEHPLHEDEYGRLLGTNFYLKLRFVDAEPREAKAYVGLMPRLMRPSAAPS